MSILCTFVCPHFGSVLILEFHSNFAYAFVLRMSCEQILIISDKLTAPDSIQKVGLFTFVHCMEYYP